jgi:2-polyprenyl-6-methoxyphenol hydroxylase-like FAD-dependent oxidoreductase
MADNDNVLVVGAGPTGLAMAIELARHGLRPRIIDRAAEPSQTSKALGVQARTMEYFERLGIAEQAIATGRQVHAGSIYSERRRIVHLTFDRIASRYNYILILPQSDTERLLTARLQAEGIEIERNVELVGCGQTAEVVEAALRHADGREETVATPWLIGCDGAHSAVRRLLNLQFEGHAFEESFSLADVRLEAELADDEVTVYLSSGDIVALFPLPGDRRYRIIIERHAGPPVEGDPTLADFQQALDAYGPAGARVSDAVWMSHFRISQRQVEHYRRGRVFLAGDAAHIHSPVGGQGMNTGIQDAGNLGWKLALVSRGRTPDRLLDSYQQERHPLGQRLLQATGAMSRAVLVRQPVLQTVRNLTAQVATNLDVVQDKIRGAMSEISINYRGSPIVASDHAAGWRGKLATWLPDAGPRAGDRAPDAAGLRTADGRQPRLFELLSGTRHHLLYFPAGTEESEIRSGEERLAAVCQRYEGLIDWHTVLPPTDADATGSLVANRLRDSAGELGKAFATTADALILIRPDGYIGYRADPADVTKLSGYLGRLFSSAKP